MNTLMITSMDQGKGLAAEALQPVPLFDAVARIAAALKAFAQRLPAVASLHVARA